MTLPVWVRDIQRQRAKTHRKSLVFSSIGITITIYGSILAVLFFQPTNGPAIPIQLVYVLVSAYAFALTKPLIVGRMKVAEHDKLASYLLVISELVISEPTVDELNDAKKTVNSADKLLESWEDDLKENEVGFASTLRSLKGLREVLQRLGTIVSNEKYLELAKEDSAHISAIAETIHSEGTVDRDSLRKLIAAELARLESASIPITPRPSEREKLLLFLTSTRVRIAVEAVIAPIFGYFVGTDLSNRVTVTVALWALLVSVEAIVRQAGPRMSRVAPRQ